MLTVALLILGVLWFSVSIVMAQTNPLPPAPVSSTGWVHYAATILSAVVPILVPLAVAGIKKLMDYIPAPVVPIIAIVIGAGMDALTAWLSNGSMWGGYGVIAGLAGIGVRELKVQLFPPKP